MKRYFDNCQTLEEVKKQYKKLVMELHPDVSGRDSTAEFQEMQNQYETAFERCRNFCKDSSGKMYTKENHETAAEYADIIAELLKMQGVVIEVIGCFLWLSGNTKEHKENIKKLGFHWSKNKSMWYKSPDGYHKTSKRQYGIGELRMKFGSEVIQAKDGQCVKA